MFKINYFAAVVLAILLMIIVIEFRPFTRQASSTPVAIAASISIDDLHRPIDMKALPVLTIKEPF